MAVTHMWTDYKGNNKHKALVTLLHRNRQHTGCQNGCILTYTQRATENCMNSELSTLQRVTTTRQQKDSCFAILQLLHALSLEPFIQQMCFLNILVPAFYFHPYTSLASHFNCTDAFTVYKLQCKCKKVIILTCRTGGA